MNSYLGIMKHYKTYNVRRATLIKNLSGWWFNNFYMSGGVVKLVRQIYSMRLNSRRQTSVIFLYNQRNYLANFSQEEKKILI